MKLQKTVLILAACLQGGVTLAESLQLRSEGNDLRVSVLTAAPDSPLANTRREAVSFSMPLNGSAAGFTTPSAFTAVSREYRIPVSAKALAQGVSVRTTAPGAVLALSPVGSVNGAALGPLDLTIKTPAGATLRGSDAMDQLVDQRAIAATGVPFSNGMIGFRFNRALGAGEFVVSANKRVTQHYVLHVFDASSRATLSLAAPEQALVGQTFRAAGGFSGNNAPIERAAGFLVSPNGDRVPAEVSIDGASFDVKANATDASSFDGLWELHVSAVDANGLQRDVKTALAAAYATARLDGTIEKRGLQFEFGIEAASAGRYEVSAVLVGTGASGPTPVLMGASAKWLERGAGHITLEFDAAALKAAGVDAPFALMSVALKDQSRMAVLERVAQGVSF